MLPNDSAHVIWDHTALKGSQKYIRMIPSVTDRQHYWSCHWLSDGTDQGNSPYHAVNSEDFIHTSDAHWVNTSDMLTSFDFIPLFTKTLIVGTLHLLSEHFYEDIDRISWSLVFLIQWPVLQTDEWSGHRLTTVTGDCQLLIGGLWGRNSQWSNLPVLLLFPVHWHHICDLAPWIRKTWYLPGLPEEH